MEGVVWVAENGQRRVGLQHLPSLHNSPLEKKSMFCQDDQCDGGSDHYGDGDKGGLTPS